MVYKNPARILQISTIKDTYDWYKTEGFVELMFRCLIVAYKNRVPIVPLILLRILMTGIRRKGLLS